MCLQAYLSTAKNLNITLSNAATKHRREVLVKVREFPIFDVNLKATDIHEIDRVVQQHLGDSLERILSDEG